MRQAMRDIETEAPELSKGFGAFHAIAMREGALPSKFKELMALAVAVVMRCDGCIAIHMKDAIDAGASKSEMLESLGVAIAMGGGPALTYAADAYRAYHEIMNDTQDYGDDRTFID